MTNKKKQRIFFVDDEPKVREMVEETLKELGTEVSCFARAADCLRQLHIQLCNLLITDVKMPDMDGIELLTEAKHLAPWMPILIVTGYGDVPIAIKAIKAGAVDFIEKPLYKKSFLRKVKTILQNSTPTDSFVGKPLTESETKVLKLVIQGKSNKEIAHLLHRSVRTIEVHRSHLMHKLGIDNLVDLVKRATIMGIVELPAKQGQSKAAKEMEKYT